MGHKCHFAEDRAEIEGECTVGDMHFIHKFLVEMAEAGMNPEAVNSIAKVFDLELPEQEQSIEGSI